MRKKESAMDSKSALNKTVSLLEKTSWQAVKNILKEQGLDTLLEIIPGGFSVAYGEDIFHNAIAAQFLRIKPWTNLSYTEYGRSPFRILFRGREIAPDELPIARAVRYGEKVNGRQLEFVWADGVRKFAIWSASPLRDRAGKSIGAIATFEDITERKQAEEELQQHRTRLEKLVEARTAELRKSTEQFKSLVENSPDMIIRFDREGRHLYVNPATEDIYGFPVTALVGKTWGEIGFPESMYRPWLDKLSYVYETTTSVMYEVEYSGSKGMICYQTIMMPELGADGLVETVLSVSRDITARKRLEKEITRLDRLNVVGEMAASIGHEVRNPMTTVRGYLQFLAQRKELAKYNEQFCLMIEEIDRANSIITEYLSLAKDKSIHFQSRNINDIVHSLLALMQAEAFKMGHHIEVSYGDIPPLLLDENEIRQLVLNLVRNSFEAMPGGGRVMVRTYRQGEDVVLAIRDNGSGIPAKVYEQMGKPFITTKPNGTGLGLPVCYRIAQRHNATIEVLTGNEGTTFFITFPIQRGVSREKAK